MIDARDTGFRIRADEAVRARGRLWRSPRPSSPAQSLHGSTTQYSHNTPESCTISQTDHHFP